MSKDVWSEMDKIIGTELLPSQQEIDEKSDSMQEVLKYHVIDEWKKLRGIDRISFKLLDRIAPSVYPSKRKCFALHALGLEESEYDQIIAETIGAEYRNFEVVFVK